MENSQRSSGEEVTPVRWESESKWESGNKWESESKWESGSKLSERKSGSCKSLLSGRISEETVTFSR
jgi:hypothetical protein